MDKMKKTVLALIIMLGCLPAVMAGPRTDADGLSYKYEFNIGWGGFPVLDATNFSNYNFLSAPDEPFFSPGSLGDIYSSYTGPTYSTGILSAEFNIQFKKWFALGLQANFDGLWSTAYSSDTGGRLGSCSGVAFSFLPYARFTYLNRPVVKLYSAVGLGIGAGYRKYDFSGFSEVLINPAFQMTPIGIMVGKRVYGLFELGAGTVYIGCKAGIGYRF